MLRRLALVLLAPALVAAPALAHELDHAPPGQASPSPPANAFQSGGRDAEWRLIGTVPTGNPHSDLDFFTRGGETFAAVGTLGTGPNSGGITIVKLAGRDGRVAPAYVSGHGSATCPSNPGNTLGLQHDVEATPKGGTVLNTFVPGAPQAEAELLVDATDARGRCHDQGTLGLQSAPKGGLELIDISDPARPVEIGMTSHIGEAHTVNIDPRRPHIAYAVTSDAVPVRDGVRANESDAANGSLDGWEVVDMSSCMGFPAGTTVEQKRAACRPQVFRFRYPSLDVVLGHTNKGTVYGCHELEVYPEDRLTCGSGSAMILFDIKGAFDDRGTPDPRDDKPRGTPLDCPVRPSSSREPFRSGAMVVDCGTADFHVKPWLEAGAPSLQGVEHVGSAFHMGRTATAQSGSPAFPSTEDIDFDHEAELTTSRRFVLATDERGGGVVPPGASCPTSPADNPNGNGGVHAFRVDRLQRRTPSRPEEAWQAYARTSGGGKAIYRAPIRTQPQGSLCTAHVFQQIPGQNRIFMGWYSQGTQVVDFTENPDGTIDFEEAGFFRPANTNQWVSGIFRAQREADGRFTYFGATGDFSLGAAGRSAIDVYSVTLPAPPAPAGGTGGQGQPPAAPAAGPGPGGTPTGGGTTGGGTTGGGTTAGRCQATAGFRTVAVRPRGRGLRFAFSRAVRRPVRVDVFWQSTGRRILGERTVATFRRRTRSFTWGGARGGSGVYAVRVTMRLPGGRQDVRRFAVERRGGRFVVRPDYYRRASCGLLRSVKLERPVFGGRSQTSLLASFRVGQAAVVSALVRDARGRIVRRFPARTYRPDRAVRLRVGPSRFRRGLATVELRARRGATQVTVRLAARRL